MDRPVADRQGVWATVDSQGRLNRRVHIRNQAGQELAPGLRTATGSIVHESVEYRAAFWNMTHEEVRAEVARLINIWGDMIGTI